MLMAKEQVIRNKFFFPDSAWKIPIPVSTWNSFVFAACLFCVSCELPLIAVTGETLEAFFAGDKTAEEAAEIIQNRVQLYLDTIRS